MAKDQTPAEEPAAEWEGEDQQKSVDAAVDAWNALTLEEQAAARGDEVEEG